MPGMSTTHDQIYQLSSSGVSIPLDTLSSDTSKQISALLAPACRKRKHADVEEENDQIGIPFTIQVLRACSASVRNRLTNKLSKQNPSLPSAKSQRLIPRLLIPRSCLPLTYLDLAGHEEEHVAPRLFSARIDNLEDDQQESRLSYQPVVLVAKSAADDRLYAVEKVQDGIYALCRLGFWVTLRLLRDLQTGATNCNLGQRSRLGERHPNPVKKWWQCAAIEPEPKVSHHVSRTQKDPKIRLCLQKPVHNTGLPTLLVGQKQSNKSPEEGECSLGDMVEGSTQEPEEMLAMIRSQYQESLYASKVSLCHSTTLRFIANFIRRPHWLTLPRDLYLELVWLSNPRMALPRTNLIL